MHLPRLALPNRDRLRDHAIEYTHHFVANPVCSTSRAVLLSGLHSPDNGVVENVDSSKSGPPLDVAIPTLGSVFQAAGYETGYFGKWHLGPPRDVAGHGFDAVYVPEDQDNGLLFDDPTSQHAAAWISRRDGSRPWLAVVSVINPHDIPFRNRYNDVAIPDYGIDLPPNFDDDPTDPSRPDELRAYASLAARITPKSPDGWREYLNRYCWLIEYTDRWLGRVIDAVDETGQREDTVFVYTSDHGEMGGAHGLVQKRFMYEEALRVPFLISGPRITSEPVTTHSLSSNIDVVPTLAALAGIDWPRSLPGINLAELVAGRPATQRDAVVACSNFPPVRVPEAVTDMTRMIRTRDSKLVVYPSGGIELFDLVNDPWEMRNVASDAKHGDLMNELRGTLGRLLG